MLGLFEVTLRALHEPALLGEPPLSEALAETLQSTALRLLQVAACMGQHERVVLSLAETGRLTWAVAALERARVVLPAPLGDACVILLAQVRGGPGARVSLGLGARCSCTGNSLGGRRSAVYSAHCVRAAWTFR